MMTDAMITVIGGANIDIMATASHALVPNDSNPGHVAMSYGGVAHNIARDLHALGHPVRFATIFGGDIFGTLCREQCEAAGLDLSLSQQRDGTRGGLYLCVNDHSGELVVAVADTEAVTHITPEWLAERIDDINNSDAVVADTNIATAALLYLLDNCTAPLMVDTVSTAKAPRIIDALKSSRDRRLHTLKLNRHEALAVTGADDIDDAVRALHAQGVQRVYVTLGSHGTLCSDGQATHSLPALPVTDIVNTNGAGDAFLAGVVHATLSGDAFIDTARAGLQAARVALLSPHAVIQQCLI